MTEGVDVFVWLPLVKQEDVTVIDCKDCKQVLVLRVPGHSLERFVLRSLEDNS